MGTYGVYWVTYPAVPWYLRSLLSYLPDCTRVLSETTELPTGVYCITYYYIVTYLSVLWYLQSLLGYLPECTWVLTESTGLPTWLY
jgi:hypothetical protein